MVFIKHELKMNRNNLLIWVLSISVMDLIFLILFPSLKDSLTDMSSAYESMGSFSQIYGMDKLAISSITGYYASMLGAIFALGGALYAGLLGTGMLSKEEGGHTAEFLFTLPCSRTKIIMQKLAAILLNLLLFHLTYIVFMGVGFVIIGESVDITTFFLYHLAQFIMGLELASLCFFCSAFSKKVNFGLGLGIVIILYAAELMAKTVPACENFKYITPFYYSDASEIFSSASLDILLTILGILIAIIAGFLGFLTYTKKDLAS